MPRGATSQNFCVSNDRILLEGKITTSGTTPSVILSYDLELQSVCYLRARVFARNGASARSWVSREIIAWREAAGAQWDGEQFIVVPSAPEYASIGSVNFIVQGNSLSIQVAGLEGHNVDWIASLKVEQALF